LEPKTYMDQSFKSIPLKFFHRLENTKCDIYLRLSEEKYVKIVNTGDIVSDDVLKNFENKNIAYFYVTKDAFTQIGQELTPLSEPPKSKVVLPDHGELNQLLTSFGVNQLTCSEVSKTYEKILTDTSKYEKISSLLGSMVYSKKRFIYDHSYLVGVISVELAKKSDWGVGATKEKMTMAALMHDLRLPEDLATMADTNELSPNVTISVRQAHLKHADMIAQELQHEPSIPDDVVKIVKDHHNLLNPHLSRLSMVFIVAHEFVTRMYNYQLTSAMAQQALRDVKTFFQGSDFDKYVEQLESIINQ